MINEGDISLYDELGRLNNELANVQRETFKKKIEMARLAAIVESSVEAIISVDLQGVFISWNAAAERLYDYKKAGALGRPVDVLILPGGAGLISAVIEGMKRGDRPESMDTEYVREGRLRRDVALTFSPLLNSAGELVGVSCFGSDITDRKSVEQALRIAYADLEHAHRVMQTIATQDGLTGLFNHRVFQERLDLEVREAVRYCRPLALLMIDVDHFKQFNDTYGHPSGDEVLKQVASMMRSAARDTDLAARYGGEEFAIILTQTDRSGAMAAAERLRAIVEAGPWDTRAITVSIGVCCLSEEVNQPAALIVCADKALYQSKAAGKNRSTLGGVDTAALQTAMTALKRETRHSHESIENRLAPLLRALSTSMYIGLLLRLLGYYRPLEAQLLKLPGLRGPELDLDGRLKSCLIMSDLQYLGVTTEKLMCAPACDRLPDVNSLDQAIGCMYVLEGATLGGQIILRGLKERLDVDAVNGASFFASYGENVGTKWQAFGRFANRTCVSDACIAVAVRAACETFDTMADWIFADSAYAEAGQQ